MRFIGITGGVGAGKSEILKYIRSHYSCEIYLADEVAHEVEEPGQPAYEKLVKLLGPGIIDESDPLRHIHPVAMAQIIFSRKDLLQQVNEIVHPAVRDYLMDRLQKAKDRADVDLFFVEAALLIECGYKELVDEMWYIHADKEIRIQRLMKTRGYSKDKALRIIESQLSEEEFRKNSDFVIDNSGNLDSSYAQIDSRLEEYRWQM